MFLNRLWLWPFHMVTHEMVCVLCMSFLRSFFLSLFQVELLICWRFFVVVIVIIIVEVASFTHDYSMTLTSKPLFCDVMTKWKVLMLILKSIIQVSFREIIISWWTKKKFFTFYTEQSCGFMFVLLIFGFSNAIMRWMASIRSYVRIEIAFIIIIK